MSVLTSTAPITKRKQARILVAPLNWGLGHVTRCIPIIRELEQMGAVVFLASDGAALDLLKAEFPHLPAFELPSYRIRYGSHNMIFNIGKKLPRILFAIRAEQWETQILVRKHGITGIIADNRYGCFTKYTHNILLTHQLNLKVPNKILQWTANKILRLSMKKFNAVWVPDHPESPGLADTLSHGKTGKQEINYIGILSRMEYLEAEIEYDLAVVLSGPEPQRTYLENKLLEQILVLPLKSIIIRGKTHAKEHYYAADHIELVSYLTSKELNKVLLASKWVVCRSGYSSIMDLVVLRKKALLIPTPGQTEQEYLAQQLAQKGVFSVQNQESLDLERAMSEIETTSGFLENNFDKNFYHTHLQYWLDQVQQDQ
jgi:uncharacterized protein (TIGR00661 family)